jgi:endonuclease-3
MDKEDVINKILDACDREDQPVVSGAYSDGGLDPLFPRLQRAAINQIDNGDATFARYAIWANTVRDNIRHAMGISELRNHPDVKRCLIRAINSLSAFSEIQALFDPMEIGRPTIGDVESRNHHLTGRTIRAIRDRLVEHGWELFHAPKMPVRFTGLPEADALLNDLNVYPHAFVLACVMDRQIKAEKAWLIPYRMSEKLHGFSMELLRPLSQDAVTTLMKQPEPLHRFADKMSVFFHSALQHIDKRYGGDASQIWTDNPPSAETVYRFLQFKGIGPKIASMAANILARDFKVPFADYFSIDISADVHVRRVFSRLGLCASDASPEQVIYRAKALYPEFPGIMDLPCWEIGRGLCKAHGPLCERCYMNDICPRACESG